MVAVITQYLYHTHVLRGHVVFTLYMQSVYTLRTLYQFLHCLLDITWVDEVRYLWLNFFNASSDEKVKSSQTIMTGRS